MNENVNLDDKEGVSKRPSKYCGYPEIVAQECYDELTILVGQDDSGNDIFIDLNKTPHLLIAGATGSGKSNLLHLIITNYARSHYHSEWQFVLIDPKCVEYEHLYHELPNLFTPIVTNAVDEGVATLNKVVTEIEERKRAKEAREPYSDTHILVAIDEFSDLICNRTKETETAIIKIAAEGAQFGIHMVIATSRPSSDVFTEDIKAAISARVAGKLNSSEDSKNFLGEVGAEKLSDAGDMIFNNVKDEDAPVRVKVNPISDIKIFTIVSMAVSEAKQRAEDSKPPSFLERLWKISLFLLTIVPLSLATLFFAIPILPEAFRSRMIDRIHDITPWP